MAPYSVHSVRFFSINPSSIHTLAFCKSKSLLALSRADNSIEIWNHVGNPILERWIPGNSESSVEALAWAGERLFSTGLHGLVLEHDLQSLSTRNQFAVTSGPAWCMEYNDASNRIAVGTEEGFVCLFQVTEEGLVYDKVMDKQEGRVLCLSWHSSGSFICTGNKRVLASQ